MSEKTWRRGLDVRFADEGGEVSFKINYLKGGAVVLTQVVLAAVYLKIAAEHGSECEPASAYINASGILFCFGAISSLASFAHFHSRSVSDQTTTSWRVPFLAAYLSGKPTLNQEEREFNGGVLTFFLAVVGIGCQAFAAATTVDMTLLLFSLLEAKQCFTGDDKNPGGPTTMLQLLGIPAAISLATSLAILVYVFVTVRGECVANGICVTKDDSGEKLPLIGGMFSSSSSSASSGRDPELQQLRRSRSCTLLCLGLATYLLAWLCWQPFAAANPGYGPLPGAWSCPAPDLVSCPKNPVPSSSTLPMSTNGSSIESVLRGMHLRDDPASRSFTMALWHEGYPVQGSGTDVDTFREYVGQMVETGKAWNFTRVYLQVFTPSSYSVFDAENVAQYFLDPLGDAGIEAAFVAYLNPKDCGWDRTDPLSDLASYISNVEAKSAGGYSIAAVSSDHEDLGALGPVFSDQVLALKKAGALSADIKMGYAGACSLFSTDLSLEPGVEELFPEMYWFGELMPNYYKTHKFDCAVDCVDSMPCFSAPCVNSPYREYVDDPTNLLQKVVAPTIEARGWGDSMQASSRDPSKKTIYGMLSIEHLSGCCTQRAYGPGNSCGTFDGFSLWKQETFLAYMDALAQNYGFNTDNPMPLAVYEFQFWPPHFADPSLSPAPTTAVAQTTAIPAKCAGTG